MNARWQYRRAGAAQQMFVLQVLLGNVQLSRACKNQEITFQDPACASLGNSEVVDRSRTVGSYVYTVTWTRASTLSST